MLLKLLFVIAVTDVVVNIVVVNVVVVNVAAFNSVDDEVVDLTLNRSGFSGFSKL